MLNVGKCPKCEKLVSNVKIEELRVDVGYLPAWKGVSYVCPWCNAIMSIQIDPVALKTDIVNEVVRRMKGI